MSATVNKCQVSYLEMLGTYPVNQVYMKLSGSEMSYRICSIRRHGYYLFHCAILCGFYLRAVFINSVLSVKSFIIVRALLLFDELWCSLISRRFATKRYLHSTSNPFPRFLPMISHDDCPPCLKNCRTSLDSVGSCTYHVLIWYCHLSPRFVHMGMCYSNISRG